MLRRLFLWFLLLTTGKITIVNAQTTLVNGVNPNYFIGKDTVRVITTAMPFLTVTPDSRAGAMGDVGAATSPDANAIFWNPAKLAFIDDKKNIGFSISYTPWLRKLVNDMSLSYITGYYKMSKQEAIGVHLTYFNLGSITFTDNQGNKIRDFNPQEFSTGATYSRKLSNNLGLALTLKFLHSNLAGNLVLDANNTAAKAANAGAADVGLYYKKDKIINAKPYHFAFGAVISNVGNKVSYTNNDQKNFIPTNLRIGGNLTVPLDEYNKIAFNLDLNKLLVPTPPLRDANGNVISGKEDKNTGLVAGMIGSFTDAPNGFREELQEIMISSGIEYWYRDIFAVRGGMFHENKYKGNRKYATCGFGIRYKTLGLDFAYLIPFVQNNPLAETLRFTLHFQFATKSVETMESITE